MPAISVPLLLATAPPDVMARLLPAWMAPLVFVNPPTPAVTVVLRLPAGQCPERPRWRRASLHSCDRGAIERGVACGERDVLARQKLGALSNAAAPLPVLICKVPVFAWKVALAAAARVPLTMTLP